jgi:hypothetical protein
MQDAGNGMLTIIATAALKSDKSVLNDINSADSVCVTNGVERLEELNRVRVLFIRRYKFYGDTFLKVYCDIGRLIRRLLGVLCHGPHIGGSFVAWVFQDSCRKIPVRNGAKYKRQQEAARSIPYQPRNCSAQNSRLTSKISIQISIGCFTKCYAPMDQGFAYTILA